MVTEFAVHGSTRRLFRTMNWDPFVSLGHPTKFQLVSRLGSVTARHV